MANEQNNSQGVPRLTFNSVESTRKTLTRIIRAHGAGKLEENLYRSLVWGISQLLAYFRLENDMQIEKRVEEIEKQLNLS